MELHALGASREVGRSSFLLRTDRNLLLDYGIKIWTAEKKPHYPIEIPYNVDAAILSHAHLDHSGFIPHLYTMGNIPWYATPPTRDICEILFQDSMKIMGPQLPYDKSHFSRAMKSWSPLFYDKHSMFGKTTVTFRDAGHIIGAAMVDIEYEGKRFLYTGDFKSEGTRLHHGADKPGKVDILMMESTYAFRDHPVRKELEKHLMDEIRETMEEGGHILFPAFALGRSQELLTILNAYDLGYPIYLDGMSRAICEVYSKYPHYVKDFTTFTDAVSSVKFIRHFSMRREAVEEPSIIISTAGMMEGGPVLDYLVNINPNSKVIFTGYNVEGTNGWRLLNEGKVIREGYELDVDLPVEYLDFSAHADRTDILNFIKKADPEKIILVHGDDPQRFAKELKDDFGYDAIAPKLGDMINL